MREKLQEVFHHVEGKLSPTLKATALLQGFGLWKVPLLFSVRPKVREISDSRAVVEIPLNRWTKNHLGSMYFGALAIGADCVVGLLGIHHIRKSSAEVHLSFKDFQADFLRRPEGDVLFVCDQGKEVAELVEKVMSSGERHSLAVGAHALVKGKEDPVARFTLTLSLKRKG